MNEHVDRSTLDEMVRYTKRITTLKERLGDAEGQLLQRWGHAYRAGLLTDEHVIDAAMQIASNGHLPSGWRARWNDVFAFDVGLSVQRRIHRRTYGDREHQNGNPGWYGTYDGSGISFPRPPKGQPVVYVLYDVHLAPIYVGSTGMFADRLKAHRRDGKPVAHWRAMPYTTREEAYLAEDAMLRTAMPEMNRKASR
jgi:hypothetical protein